MWRGAAVCLCLCLGLVAGAAAEYQVGVGIADITGPAAEINMMGYAKMAQVSKGIHTRQFSRAFVIGDNATRAVIISIDCGMVSHPVKLEVTRELRERFGDLYTEENVLLTATHTHATPGGYLQYLLYLIPSQGFIHQTFRSLVQGIVKSVERAHANLQPGHVLWNVGEVGNASINRSPTAYLHNPHHERDRYGSNVDTEMFLLKFTDMEGTPLGTINWFAVHPTSMNSSNQLISGDNKGAASLMFETEMNGPFIPPGKGKFVAAFAQANAGDVSPNILGAVCPSDSSAPCDVDTSTCQDGKERCIALGPGKDQFESTWIIGERQFRTAKALFESAERELRGPVLYIHQHVDMSNVELEEDDNSTEKRRTCKPAMGFSFAAGTIDCPGEFDFLQGTTKGSTLWNIVVDFIRRPSKELRDCQHPKPVLLATGEMSLPYKWQPDVVPTQIILIGQLAILAVPAEITTMAGRRLRNTVKKVLEESSGQEFQVVIASLSNAYSSYVTTYEEYQVQRYEGASTMYGPHTLSAYERQFEMLADHLLLRSDDGGVDHSLRPPDPSPASQIGFKAAVRFDGLRRGQRFGDVLQDASPIYEQGSTVKVTFVSGHPRNDMMLERTFLTVERWNNETGVWDVVATDANWETKFEWERTNALIGESVSTVTWSIPAHAQPGLHRVRHFGNSKNLLQVVKPYVGTSSPFRVIPS